MAKRILIRRDVTANWETVNPILSNGEFGIEFKTDGTRSLKLGTGALPWNSLQYFIDNPASEVELDAHINDTSAHSATATPSSSLIAMYNSDAGLKSNKIPSESNDVLRKSELDTLNGSINVLESNLNTEITDRENADTTLQININAVQTNLNTEITNRTTADTTLQTDIDAVASNLADEIINRGTAVSNAISTAASDATTKANTAEQNAKDYADDLALATQVWLPAVETKDDLPTNPGNGTYLCRVISGTDYGVYQWIGTETTPAWTFFSDNLDFIDRITNPTTNNIPIITSNGELTDSGTSISDITDDIDAKEDTITAGTTSQYWRGDKTWQTLNKAAVGLGNVDNTTDLNKPISTATQTALDDKVDNATLDDYYTETEVDTLLDEKEPSKYIAADESAAETYSTSNPTIIVFYPEA
jgi:hypothetical protein